MIRFARGRHSSIGNLNRPGGAQGPVLKPKVKNSSALISARRTTSMQSLPPLPDEDTETSLKPQIIPKFVKAVFQLEKLGDLSKHTVISTSVAESQRDPVMAEKFVRGFILDKTQDTQAIIIQRAFRLFLKRIGWKKRIALTMRYHEKLKQLVMLNWRLATEKDPAQLRKMFRQFEPVYRFFNGRMKIRKIAPFQLFYVTGRIFLPEGYEPIQIYKYVYYMSANFMHRVVHLWHVAAKGRREHRTSLNFIRFTSKKYKTFGNIYLFFQNWQRYTKWKKLAGGEKLTKFVCLQESETNVVWRVHQEIMNAKRSRIVRATEASRKRIAAKAVRALYNRSIERISEQLVVERSDMFRNMHLQALGHRAWLKFMQRKSREQQFLRDTMRGWYEVIYGMRQAKFQFELSEKLQKESHIMRIMNQWYRVVQEMKVARLQKMLMVQRAPSMIIALIFFMQGEIELFYSAMCFRDWIRYTRARRKWRRFLQWSADPENSDKDTKHLVLCQLKRAAAMKLSLRSYASKTKFFPRNVGFSLELALKSINDIKQRGKLEAKKHWKFETIEDVDGKSTVDLSSYLALIRCLVVRLHSIKNYDLSRMSINSSGGTSNPAFERFRTLAELEQQCDSNTTLMKKRMSYKLRRDRTVLAGMVSHMSALQFGKVQTFSTQDSFLFLPVPGLDDDAGSVPITVYPDLDESVDELIKQIRNEEPKIPSSFEEAKNKAFQDFQNQLRDPRSFLQRNEANSISVFQPDSASNENNDPSRNSMISVFVSAKGGMMRRKSSKILGLLSSFAGGNNDVAGFFTVKNLKQCFGHFSDFEDILSTLHKIISDASGVQIDCSKTFTFAKSSEIAANADPRLRRAMIKNINRFIADFMGLTGINASSRSFTPPQIIVDAVSAICTIHNALRATNLWQYCDDVPFPRALPFDDKLVQSSRERLWNALKKRFPKLELPTASGALMAMSNLVKLRNSSTSFLTGSSASLVDENVTSHDGVLAVFLLPFVLNFDSLIDFTKDEIHVKSNQPKK